MFRREAFGFRNQASGAVTEVDTIFRMASMSKTVVTAAALVLIEDKKLRLDNEISRWVPELGNRRVLRMAPAQMAP
jgi:CubicO group peptidase (beta-lactamase class C family)